MVEPEHRNIPRIQSNTKLFTPLRTFPIGIAECFDRIEMNRLIKYFKNSDFIK